MRVAIRDEELNSKGLRVFVEGTRDFSAVFIGYLDRVKCGFETRLISYQYNPNTFIHTFEVEKFNDV